MRVNIATEVAEELSAGNTTRASFDELLNDVFLNPVDGLLQHQPDLVYDPGERSWEKTAAGTRCTPSFTSMADDVSPTSRFGSMFGKSQMRSSDCKRLAILLHGFGSCPGLWYFLEAPLSAQGFCILRPLLPGHGLAPKPVEGSYYNLKVRFDRNSVQLQDSDLQVKDTGILLDLGIQIEYDEKSDMFIVQEVKQHGMVYAYNTLVANREVASLDMLMPGDQIPADQKNGLVVLHQKEGHLYLLLPSVEGGANAASEWFNNPANKVELRMQRLQLQDDVSAMPTTDDWDRYDDFSRMLAELGAAFKAEHPSGEVVIMGHSLGAAVAASAVVHAPHPDVFDRVLLLNPAFGTNNNFDWALSTVGNWLPLSINNDECQRTRYTLGTGGYCSLHTQNANGVRKFGNYAFCRFLQAAGHDPSIWNCARTLDKKGLAPGILTAGSIEIVTTYLDAAINNDRVNQVASYAQSHMGEESVGFCYLKGELTHNFLNELGSVHSGTKPFWWHEALTDHMAHYLGQGEFFPIQTPEQVKEEGSWVSATANVAGTVGNLLLLGLPKLIGHAAGKLAHTDIRCDLDTEVRHKYL